MFRRFVRIGGVGAAVALAATTIAIATGGDRSVDARLGVTDKRIDAGERTGMIVRNTGERRILYGLGAQIARRESGEWVTVPFDQCRRGCEVPDVGLTLRPGAKAGPRYGGFRDVIRLSDDAEPGRYRLTKEILNSAHARRSEEMHEVIYVR